MFVFTAIIIHSRPTGKAQIQAAIADAASARGQAKRNEEEWNGGRYWTRTSDLMGVIHAL